jgi:lambda family phage tail tape measure protein
MCTTGKADFKSLAMSIIQDIMQMIIKAQIAEVAMAFTKKDASGNSALGQIGSGIGGFFAGLFNAGMNSGGGGGGWTSADYTMGDAWEKGGAFAFGNVVPFATGDIFSRPTVFPMARGKVGMLGEAGPEAIMPLTRGAGGRLGVGMDGGSQPQVNLKIVNVTDKKQTLDNMGGPDGEKVVMNAMRRNSGIASGLRR